MLLRLRAGNWTLGKQIAPAIDLCDPGQDRHSFIIYSLFLMGPFKCYNKLTLTSVPEIALHVLRGLSY